MVLLQQRQARKAAAITEERNQADRTRFLALQVRRDVVVGQLVCAGDANVVETETPASLDVVLYLDRGTGQRERIQVLTRFLGAVDADVGGRVADGARLRNLGEKVTVLLKIVSDPARRFGAR